MMHVASRSRGFITTLNTIVSPPPHTTGTTPSAEAASRSSLTTKVRAKRLKPWQALAILLAIRRELACDDVVDVTHRKTLHHDTALPCICEAFNAIRGEHQIDIERSVLQLHEVLAAANMDSLLVIDGESDLSERENDGRSVRIGLFDEKVGVLGRVGKAEQDGT